MRDIISFDRGFVGALRLGTYEQPPLIIHEADKCPCRRRTSLCTRRRLLLVMTVPNATERYRGRRCFRLQNVKKTKLMYHAVYKGTHIEVHGFGHVPAPWGTYRSGHSHMHIYIPQLSSSPGPENRLLIYRYICS